ncbi:ABC transporter ATP-binding protein [Candidatus Uhrbacteria bacterium]|nr:ABC transporter ATP-binding protein [Candidatus Uhrbacteria bacterium]
MKVFFTKASSFARLIRRAFGVYRMNIAKLIAVGFLSGLFEGIGVNALVPLFAFLIPGADPTAANDPISRTIRFFFTSLHIPFTLKYLLLFIALLFFLRAAVVFAGSIIKTRIITSYETSQREALLKAFLGASWSYALREKLGHMATMILTDVNYSGVVLEHLCNLIIIAFNLTIYLIIALNISATLTIFTFFFGICIFFFFRPLLGRSKKFSHDIETLYKKVSHFLSESTIGMKAVKSVSAERIVADKGSHYFNILRDTRNRISILRSLGDVLMQPIGVIFICIIFAFSYKAAGFQIGSFVAVIYLIQRIFIYFQLAQGSLREIFEYTPYLQAVVATQDRALASAELDPGTEDFTFEQTVECRDLGFGYPGRPPVLSDVNLTIKKGQVIGLIGPSGAGKTTLVDLLLRLFDPITGQILVDGTDAAAIRRDAWRANVGYVSQDVFLMNDTVTNNIRFYDTRLTDEEIHEAAKQANIHEFIRSLPNGYDTVIGERGTLLSVGQRQRLIIARVLARKPQLLILDEATSSLDNESERQIQQVIEGLRGKITVLMIAHRLSTVLNTDRIFVLADGTIIEEGRPQDLLNDPESYFARTYSIASK